MDDAERNRDAVATLAGIDVDPHALPTTYVAPDVPGTGGVIKQRPEDFVVEEVPLYEPEGTGEHAYVAIRRRSMSTLDVVRLLASHFDVPRKAIGYAGLKDKHAVTTQVFSIRLPTRRIEAFPPLDHPRAEIVRASRHANKLRRGHLKGNRFVIRIREVDPASVAHVRTVLDLIAHIGAPARFGPQRFGHLGRNHLAGRALVLGECRQFLDLLLGPCDAVQDAQPEGRELYRQARYREAVEAFPPSLKPERAALRRLADGSTPEHATLAIGRVERSFFGSAMQSAIFNGVLDRRLREGTVGVLLLGDIAMTHPHRALFDVDEAVLAAPDTPQRLAHLELSPTGPLWGRSMRLAQARVREAEAQALELFGLSPASIERSSRSLTGPLEGSRRPFRVPLTEHRADAGTDEHGAYIECAFMLPRGAFATTVLEEIMKVGRADPGAEE